MEQTKARIKMIKTILADGVFDDTVYNCEVYKYDAKEERIYLLLKDADILKISLDGFYECTMTKKEETIQCEGKVVERYCSQEGNVLCFQVEKGFYKINLNCVDKEEA